MAFDITDRTRKEIAKRKLEPQLVLEIQGLSTLFGAVKILRYIKVGDPGLLVGDSWKIGGLTPIEDQEDIISFDGGTNTSINQQLYPDKGSVSSVSSIQISLQDKNEIITRLISPGIVLDEILGRKALLWMGFQGTAFKDDYIPIFQGIIDEIDAGAVDIKLNLAHPEQLKRQEIFIPIKGTIVGSLDSSQTTIPIDSVSANIIPIPVLGPNGGYDDSIRYYIKVEDEIIRYTGLSTNNLTGCTRGQLGTVPAAHTVSSDPIAFSSLNQIQGEAIEIALKIMMSGYNDYYITDLPIQRYLRPDPIVITQNAVFFQGIDLNQDYGVFDGDYITISGATAGANNCTLKQITDVIKVETGSYCVVLDVDFVEELTSSAVASFRSQYDTLGDGLAMTPDQVDVQEHIFWNNAQLANYSYRFVLQDQINGKDFLDKQVYMPIGAYSVPRRGRCSMGYHAGPVIRGPLLTLGINQIKDPDKLRMRRGLGKNFYNTVVYQFDKLVSTGAFASGAIDISAESRDRIDVGVKAFVIKSDGMRRALGGVSTASSVGDRYLNRYRFAAEYFENVGVMMRDGFTIEPGDTFLFDPTGLKVVNSTDGNRNKPPKQYGVINKTLDIKTGAVTISITDTNFDGDERFGTISPTSEIVSGSTTHLIIKDSFGSLFPLNESRKWKDYVGLRVKVHSPDYTFSEEVTLLNIDPSNKYKLNISPLSLAPSAGYEVDIADYPDSTDPLEAGLYKGLHVFLGPTVQVLTGVDDFTFTVSPSDIDKFIAGQKVRIHNDDFTVDSDETEILSAIVDTVVLKTSLGFIPDNTTVAEYMGFKDGGKPYRIF